MTTQSHVYPGMSNAYLDIVGVVVLVVVGLIIITFNSC